MGIIKNIAFLQPVKKFQKQLRIFPVLGACIVLGTVFNTYHTQNMAAHLKGLHLAKGLVGAGKTAVVVGATSGIGEGCALRLAEAGFSVVALGRSTTRGQKVVEQMKKQGAFEKTDMKLECSIGIPGYFSYEVMNNRGGVEVDAFDLKDVARAAAEVREKHPVVDVLVLSQGMATVQGFTPTPDGNDQKLTLHYWSRMAMVSELLPRLRLADTPRVISILSGGVHTSFNHFEEDPELKNGHYSISNAANVAGFYNDLGLDWLATQAANAQVAFVHASPGFVNTNWGTEMPWYIRGPVRLLQPLGRTSTTCAEYMCAPVYMNTTELKRGQEHERSKKNGVVILDQNAQPGGLTSMHSPQSRAFVWAKTAEVLRRAGLGGEHASEEEAGTCEATK